MPRLTGLALMLVICACSDDVDLPGVGRDLGALDALVAIDSGLDAGGLDAEAPDLGPPGPPRRVFVTTARFNGNLGGLGGGDAKCQAEADAESLGGEWKAWLSTPAQNAIQRIADVGPWVLVDRSARVFATRAAIAAGPEVAVRLNAAGTEVTALVWTGTRPDGTISEENCQSWTSGFPADFAEVGDNQAAGLEWTSTATQTCSGSGALYCFEQ